MKNQAFSISRWTYTKQRAWLRRVTSMGSIRMRATVARGWSDPRAVRGLGRRVYVAFDEGTQAQWLHDLLQPHAERVIVCKVHGRSETSNKSDRIDAGTAFDLLVRLCQIQSGRRGSKIGSGE
jgi:hypothetical protein